MEDSNLERKRLLDSFKQSLKSSRDEMFYEEYELIEIFDYAGDLEDGYIQMEVLLCGSRLYPKSTSFLERQGIYFSIYSYSNLGQFLDNHTDIDSVIFDILRLRNENPTQSAVIKERLSSILDKQKSLDDEEIIQLVKVASHFNQEDWLLKNIDVFRTKNNYQPTALFEIAIALEMKFRVQDVIPILEELTEIEPFNSDFWTMLASEYVAIGKYAEGKTALEYALAIEPTDREACLLNARIKSLENNSQNDIINILETIRNIDNSNSQDEFLLEKLLYDAYLSSGKTASAISLVKDLNRQYPDEKAFINELIKFDIDGIDDILEQYMETSIDDVNNEDCWLEWAYQLSMNNDIDGAIHLLLFIEKKGILDSRGRAELIGYLFTKQEYATVVSMFNQYIANNLDVYSDDFNLFIIIASSLYRIGNFKDSETLCEHLLNEGGKFNMLGDINNALKYEGILNTARNILYLVQHPEIPFESTNPITFQR